MICVRLIPYVPQTVLANNAAGNMPSSSPFHQNSEYPAVFATVSKSHNEITVDFLLRGDTTKIRWPAHLPRAQKGDALWKHTCFELFIADSHSSRYWEYNFSPSKLWAIYGFDDYRQPNNSIKTSQPRINPPRLTETTFSMQTTIILEPSISDKSLSIGVSAVVEYCDGVRQYFALCHSGPRPDFHRRDSFIINMKS